MSMGGGQLWDSVTGYVEQRKASILIEILSINTPENRVQFLRGEYEALTRLVADMEREPKKPVDSDPDGPSVMAL